MKNRLLPLIFTALLVTTSLTAQVCGTYEGSYEEQEQKYPAFYQGLESLNADLETNYKSALSKLTHLKVENGKKIIPVVVHVIHDMGGENISDASIQGALDILNANINGQASNFLTKTPDIFASVRGDLNIEFRLAKKDPLGNPTSGIVRVRSELTHEPEPRNAVKALSYWNSYQYLNIWTLQKFLPQDDGNTLLGYAQFPWSNRMSTDGVVLLASQMISGGTLTHECGHWLGLRHVWGDADCGDDGVGDTPPAYGPNFGIDLSDFPYHVGNIGIGSGCVADSLNPAGEMFVNYMDYSQDADVTMFTKGQNAVMNETLEGIYDTETNETGIGYREYMWSADNILATGVSDGYLTPTCSQKADFTITTGISSMCKGEDIIIKGNKSQFGNGNVTEMSWDFGDNTLSANDNANFLTHTYATEGLFDISFTVVYNETTEARAASLSDLDLSNVSSYDSIVKTIIVQGTESELTTMGAINIALHLDLDGYSVNSYWENGVYYPDTLFYRGELAQTTYIAYYDNTCTSTTVKENFISVNPTSSSNTTGSYTYSFENEADLSDDWHITTNAADGDWSFNSTQNSSWEWVNGIAISGNASIMIDKDNLTLGSDELISKAYDLSALSNPAIKFSWSGAAANTFPVNELKVYYSDDCGEVWRALGSLAPVEAANAGLYTTNFKPDATEWSDTIMTKAQLKNDNIKFKFEYVTAGSANNFYIDNIRIGEASALSAPTVNASKLSIYPNPTNGQAVITLEELADMNVEVRLVNILGAEVRNLFEGEIVSNYYVLDNIDLSALETGIYFVKVVAKGNVVTTDKLILSK
ncbi:MAG TPA: T9SS type A sorting domain-containing protein [Flavobacteriales bacterium]|nr:T9SS type A sorting domain-containing protein [Flavobacteriales bacterium]